MKAYGSHALDGETTLTRACFAGRRWTGYANSPPPGHWNALLSNFSVESANQLPARSGRKRGTKACAVTLERSTIIFRDFLGLAQCREVWMPACCCWPGTDLSNRSQN